MNAIAARLKEIKSKLGINTQLIVVSKYRSVAEIETAYSAGQRAFAENRVQALLERYEALPKDIEWHLIGHLQTNKAKYVVPFVKLIHSADSLKLLQEINKQAAKINKLQDVLLQVFVAQEETKFGLEPAEVKDLLATTEFQQMQNVRVCGLMAMGSNTIDNVQIKKEFTAVADLFHELKTGILHHNDAFTELSIGMSGDYPIAVECGSTMVRVGSKVFEG
ncbi:MAG: YggS family pyridoxal phosphate-dependent enzyme [Sphingomonadales bacterium]|nr:YggS family pyridoxal phosphate-dependent enzyme [Sphingomonadales bacterium]